MMVIQTIDLYMQLFVAPPLFPDFSSLRDNGPQPVSAARCQPGQHTSNFKMCDLSMQCTAGYLICQMLQVVVGRRYYVVCFECAPVHHTGCVKAVWQV